MAWCSRPCSSTCDRSSRAKCATGCTRHGRSVRHAHLPSALDLWARRSPHLTFFRTLPAHSAPRWPPPRLWGPPRRDLRRPCDEAGPGMPVTIEENGRGARPRETPLLGQGNGKARMEAGLATVPPVDPAPTAAHAPSSRGACPQPLPTHALFLNHSFPSTDPLCACASPLCACASPLAPLPLRRSRCRTCASSTPAARSLPTTWSTETQAFASSYYRHQREQLGAFEAFCFDSARMPARYIGGVFVVGVFCMLFSSSTRSVCTASGAKKNIDKRVREPRT